MQQKRTKVAWKDVMHTANGEAGNHARVRYLEAEPIWSIEK
jgi:hypothetical protein